MLQDEAFYQQGVSVLSRDKYRRLRANTSRTGHCVQVGELGALVGFFQPFSLSGPLCVLAQ